MHGQFLSLAKTFQRILNDPGQDLNRPLTFNLLKKKAHSFNQDLTLRLPLELFVIKLSQRERFVEPNLPFFLFRTSNSFTPLFSFIGVYHK